MCWAWGKGCFSFYLSVIRKKNSVGRKWVKKEWTWGNGADVGTLNI